MADINIHDYATFEQEEVITQRFINTLRRKTYMSDSEMESEEILNNRQVTFRKVALEVVQKENVLLAMKHYSHRSDTESEVEEEESGYRPNAVSGDSLPPTSPAMGTHISAQSDPCTSLKSVSENYDQSNRSCKDNNNIPSEILRNTPLSACKHQTISSPTNNEPPPPNSLRDPSEITVGLVCIEKENHQKVAKAPVGSQQWKDSTEDLDDQGTKYQPVCPCLCVLV